MIEYFALGFVAGVLLLAAVVAAGVLFALLLEFIVGGSS